jgi:hypothetical protein
MGSDNMVRIRYGPGETGWAEDLGGGEYRIANVPLCGNLNIDDVVTADHDDDGMLAVAEVVRSPMPHKVGFRYARAEDYRAFVALAHERGCRVEGMLGPRGDKPGLAQVAYPDGVDVEALAREAGIVGFELFSDDDDDDDDDDDGEEDECAT